MLSTAGHAEHGNNPISHTAYKDEISHVPYPASDFLPGRVEPDARVLVPADHAEGHGAGELVPVLCKGEPERGYERPIFHNDVTSLHCDQCQFTHAQSELLALTLYLPEHGPARIALAGVLS